ncbi:RNA polymerase sigma-70 factor [Flectobacillus rivi]|uniref:RNA polymerase sigma-70 factor n=2 Tax=Flectobacillus TaxID=101 RepID=A0ABT6Z8N7_9BACT|nr:RNA polymerase sigma-70 factor [Flectobacillus rivi]MDI9876971.1 RNA polymerase sigma-70 factor [Flectobacillus rivi]
MKDFTMIRQEPKSITTENDNPALEFVEPQPETEGRIIDGAELAAKLAFQTHPQKGCEILFGMYYRALCSHAIRYVYIKEVAEDIVSDVFCNFWKTQAYQSVTTSYRAYLFRAVRNRALNYLANEFKQSDSLEKVYHLEGAELPEQIMQYEELHQKIELIINTLPKQCQRVFLMNRFEGKKAKEIADELDISHRTVETHIHKAIQALKFGLKDLFLWISLYFLF